MPRPVSDRHLKERARRLIKPPGVHPEPADLELKVALKDETPGKITMTVKQYGSGKSDEVELHSYAEAAHLDKLTIYAGDSQAMLVGTRLDQVAKVELNGIHFAPAGLSRVDTKDELRLTTDALDISKLNPGDKITARTDLKDGRVLNLERDRRRLRARKLRCSTRASSPARPLT